MFKLFSRTNNKVKALVEQLARLGFTAVYSDEFDYVVLRTERGEFLGRVTLDDAYEFAASL